MTERRLNACQRIEQRIVKLGGSLLSWPEWPEALLDWLQHQSPIPTILIPGGGLAVDELRRRQSDLAFSDEQAHWAAVQIMSRHAILVSQQLSWPLLHSFPKNGAKLPAVLDVANLLQQQADWPTDWGFTSDSIAARLASEWSADNRKTELVLLKSRTVEGANLKHWADQGFVDTRLPEFAASLPVRVIDLRTRRLST